MRCPFGVIRLYHVDILDPRRNRAQINLVVAFASNRICASTSIEKKTLLQDPVDFLNTFGIIERAIAFAIGLAAASTLVKEFINP